MPKFSSEQRHEIMAAVDALIMQVSARVPFYQNAAGTVLVCTVEPDRVGTVRRARVEDSLLGVRGVVARVRPQDEAYWRARMSAARESVRSNEVFAEALQSRINALTAEFTAKDDPYQRAKVADDRQKALAELQRVKTEVDNSKKLIADIEDEARRAGVPPGWIR